MGLEQEIIIAEDNSVVPKINQENGEWINAYSIREFNKSYWLHSRIELMLHSKGCYPLDGINCKTIPISYSEMETIYKDIKEALKPKNEFLLDKYFKTKMYYNKDDLKYVYDEMRNFINIIEPLILNGSEEDLFYYWSWW